MKSRSYHLNSVKTVRWPSPDSLRGTVHDVAGDDALEGFAALSITGAKAAPILWIDSGLDLYAPGIAWLALDPARLILAEADRDSDRLGALEIALRGGMHGVAKVNRVSRLAARRLALAARKGGGVGFVLHSEFSSDSNAFAARWRVTSAPSSVDGAARWRVNLLYARGANPGTFLVEVDRHATSSALALVAERHDNAAQLRLAG